MPNLVDPPQCIEQAIEVFTACYSPNDQVYSHSCLWGDFNFCLNGLFEYEVEGQFHLAPPSYGLWIPPYTEHNSHAIDEQPIHYVAIRLAPELSRNISAHTEILSVSPFFRALVEETLKAKDHASLEMYRHLLWVIYDQLQTTPKHQHYLPQSHHPILQPLLQHLRAPEYFQLSLQQCLITTQLSERQLLRLSQNELHMGLSEWRNRAKLLYAIQQLKHGVSIKALSFALGYQHSSSFIEFFKRYTGKTPTQLRD